MKKVDKLVLDAFIGPFLITFLVVVFILLNINMLKYFDDIIGKGLDGIVLGQLFFYFAIFTVPTAMPLAVLLSSLIAFGNLGEHFELTAIKSAGISLVRILRPIFYFVVFLTCAAFYANNNLVPKAALEAYSLLYDIKQKKPALELREGTFYSGIDNLSIKVSKKFPDDDQALKGVIVYDHRKNDGNKEVTVADSGRMYTILNERYLKFELFNGYNYIEGAGNQQEITGKRSGKNSESMSRSKFTKTQVVFDLSSFQLQTTDKKWFQGNRIMRNLRELNEDMDSLNTAVLDQRLGYYLAKPTYFTFYARNDSLIFPPEIYARKMIRDSISRIPFGEKVAEKKGDSLTYKIAAARDSLRPEMAVSQKAEKGILKKADVFTTKKAKAVDSAQHGNGTTQKPKLVIKNRPGATMGKNVLEMDSDAVAARAIEQARLDSVSTAKIDSIFMQSPTRDQLQGATNAARQVKSQIQNSNSSVENYKKEYLVFEVQWHKILASSFACIAMFLIGAPLGAIIKKGGLGVPFLVSIFFFIVYYVITMQGEKLAKRDIIDVFAGVWMADFVLFAIGLIFLRQARADARFFEADFYSVVMDKVKRWLSNKQYLQGKVGRV